MNGHTILFFLLSSSFLSILTISTAANDTITVSQSLRDGQTISSAGGSFELGFFSPPGNSTRRYLGIWYKELAKTVAWVANRDIPLLDSSGVLNITSRGILVLFNSNNTIIWSTNASRSVQNPVAQLLEWGNLVVKAAQDNNPENFLWQSFDYPGDTALPRMKFGKNKITGREWFLRSWKSTSDPSPGDYTWGWDFRGYPQMFIRKNNLVDVFRFGSWNGLRFSGTPRLRTNRIYSFSYVNNQQEMYYTYGLVNESVITKVILHPDGIYERLMWIARTKTWSVYRVAQTDNCDTYNFCGAHGRCNIGNAIICGCLEGFVARSQQEWDRTDWSGGCVRKTQLECPNGDGFIKYTDIKLPDTRSSWFNESMTLEECRVMCLTNCSCMGYTNSDIRDGGSGCLLWFGDLVDIRVFREYGQEIYIRMSSSEIGKIGSNGKKRVRIIAGLVSSAVVLILGLVLILCIRKKKKPSKEGKKGPNPERPYTGESHKEDLDLPLIDFATVAKATNDFSDENKLGEGGFGPVYKGVLEDGKEIAVKRLSKSSKQGIDEFKNEVLCIAKLQHRNLVKLLGCCIEEEKMLIYEYMPNKSLDFYIFDLTHKKSLNWQKRNHIINGIARGLFYLHQDSRLRIIHRDLKASNILLDYELNPKISDFGMARSFGGNETEANTSRVVGTYGYMSPEYVIDGLFSIKSDVYSFGVLVLEIVSGKKNKGFQHPDHQLNLLGHAYTLYGEGRSLELIDELIENSYNLSEVLQAIHVGLLCVQTYPEDRPTMSSVVLMLGSETPLPKPKQPGFFAERNPHEEYSSSSKPDSCTVNEVTVTLLSGR